MHGQSIGEFNGPALLSVVDGSVGASSAPWEMYRNVWKDTDMKVAATNLNGYYTATLPDLAALTNASDAFWQRLPRIHG